MYMKNLPSCDHIHNASPYATGFHPVKSPLALKKIRIFSFHPSQYTLMKKYGKSIDIP